MSYVNIQRKKKRVETNIVLGVINFLVVMVYGWSSLDWVHGLAALILSALFITFAYLIKSSVHVLLVGELCFGKAPRWRKTIAQWLFLAPVWAMAALIPVDALTFPVRAIPFITWVTAYLLINIIILKTIKDEKSYRAAQWYKADYGIATLLSTISVLIIWCFH